MNLGVKLHIGVIEIEVTIKGELLDHNMRTQVSQVVVRVDLNIK